MKNPKNKEAVQIKKVLSVLPIDKQQKALARAYLLGKKDESVLEQMKYCDLSSYVLDSQRQQVKDVFCELMAAHKQEQMRRLFELLYAIGNAACYPLIQIDIFTAKGNCICCDPVKGIIVYLYAQFYNNWNGLFGGNIKKFIQIAENDPNHFISVLNLIEEIERMFAYMESFSLRARQERQDQLRLVLLMAYFIAKYNNSEETAVPPENDSGDMPEIVIESEDVPFMKQYEDIILSHFGDLFQNNMDAYGIAKLVTAIVENQITPEIKKLAASVGVEKVWLHYYGGTAYLNYNLSVTLKNIVKICLETYINRNSIIYNYCWDNRNMLEVIRYISSQLFMDIEYRGTNYDKVFDIDSRRYIQWAALNQYQVVLEQQFQSNRESFLYVMEEQDWDWGLIYRIIGACESVKSEFDLQKELSAFNFLCKIVNQQDAPLYQQLLAEDRQQNVYRERLINMLFCEAGKRDCDTIIRNYLCGLVAVDTLYPVLEQFQVKHVDDLSITTDCFMAYIEQFQDDPFHRRWETYLILKRNVYFIVRDISVSKKIEDGLSPVKVRKLFENLDQEGLAIAYQFEALMMLAEKYGRDESWAAVLVENAVGSFLKYLHRSKEETFKAFRAGDAFGRFFALRVMREDPEENKAEILYFSKDNTKKVQEELLDILYGQKNWEEDIKQLLNANNAKQREIAVKVLFHWQENRS